MTQTSEPKPRRDFLLKSMASVATAGVASTSMVGVQATSAAPNTKTEIQNHSEGYLWLKPSEQGFVEALVNHMCPADELSDSGEQLGLNVYFDRALGGDWGSGNRLFLKGPFYQGTSNQGYQLGLTPSQLFRVSTHALLAYCQRQYGKSFEALTVDQKEGVLKGLQSGQLDLGNGIPSSVYFEQLLQMFKEAMFADPIYGGNRGKQGWKMIGYPGVITNYRQSIVRFKDQPFSFEPTSMSDLD